MKYVKVVMTVSHVFDASDDNESLKDIEEHVVDYPFDFLDAASSVTATAEYVEELPVPVVEQNAESGLDPKHEDEEEHRIEALENDGTSPVSHRGVDYEKRDEDK